MAQSSVEWLATYIKSISSLNHDEVIEQAKAMHRQEIINAWMATDNELQRIAAEQYYNETYGTK